MFIPKNRNQRPVRLAYQPPATVILSRNKPATSNQPAVLSSQNKQASAISHQPTEQAANQNIFSGSFTLIISISTKLDRSDDSRISYQMHPIF
jgi:hypothetical protein